MFIRSLTVLLTTAELLLPSKPDTVEKILSRISNSDVGDQVIAAILDSYSLPPRTMAQEVAHADCDGQHVEESNTQGLVAYSQSMAEQDLHGSIVSPLSTLMDVVASDSMTPKKRTT